MLTLSSTIKEWHYFATVKIQMILHKHTQNATTKQQGNERAGSGLRSAVVSESLSIWFIATVSHSSAGMHPTVLSKIWDQRSSGLFPSIQLELQLRENKGYASFSLSFSHTFPLFIHLYTPHSCCVMSWGSNEAASSVACFVCFFGFYLLNNLSHIDYTERWRE